MIACQPLCAAVGMTQASSVMRVSASELELLTTTTLVVPLKLSAPPYLPATQVAPLIVPVFALPEASATAVPVPSLNAYAATSPVEAAVVALATLEYALALPLSLIH